MSLNTARGRNGQGRIGRSGPRNCSVKGEGSLNTARGKNGQGRIGRSGPSNCSVKGRGL